MEIHPIDVILGRIAVATRSSPIAVFKQGGGLASVFFATSRTRSDIQNRAGDYVGAFHNGIDAAMVKRRLEAAATE